MIPNWMRSSEKSRKDSSHFDELTGVMNKYEDGAFFNLREFPVCSVYISTDLKWSSPEKGQKT